MRLFAQCLSIMIMLVLLIAPSRATAQSNLGARFDQMNDSRPGVTATHRIGFTYTETSQPVGSVSLEFCSNSPIIGEVCDIPVGLDLSAAILAAQTGETGFSLHTNTTANRVVLTRPSTNPASVPSTYQFDNVTNPTDVGTYYIRLQTYASDDGTGTEIEFGGIAIAINQPFDVSGEVPPWLEFCVGVTITNFDCASANNFFIDFGFLSTTQARFATSQFVAGTNAEFGYNVTLAGTTLTSGTNTIPGLLSPDSSLPGTSQFGINLRANSSPNIGDNVVGAGSAAPDIKYNTVNQYAYTEGDIIASVSDADAMRKFTVSYITNISPAQAGGVYATTISYICLANF